MKIILLRHGQYRETPNEKLTALGRKQARLTAQALRAHGIDRIVSSTAPRARETTAILRDGLKYRGLVSESDLLREADFKSAGDLRRLARAFKVHFESSKEETVLLVCHGNTIRYLTCRALGLKPRTGLRFDIKLCGFSVFETSSRRTGKTVLISHNETGHLPFSARVFS